MFLHLIFLIWLKYSAAQIIIHDSGIGHIESDDVAIIFYVTLENTCNLDLEITANMTKCCEYVNLDEEDCVSMYLIGGQMGILTSQEIKNVTLIFPNLFLNNRKGTCDVSIAYHDPHVKPQEIKKEIIFNTFAAKEEDEKQTSAVDFNPLDNSNPEVDCLVIYSGTRSFYNHKNNRCELATSCMGTIAKCLPDSAYMVESNKCRDLNEAVTRSDLEQIESNDVLPYIEPSQMSRTTCHHGSMDNTTGECVCDAEWITTTSNEDVYEPKLGIYHMCNVEVNNWNHVNKNKIRTTALLIAIFAVTIASKILILMCILNWCYSWLKAPYKKQIYCDREEHPNDNSFIICDAAVTQTYDTCLCTEDKEVEPEEEPREDENIQTDDIRRTTRDNLVVANYMTNIDSVPPSLRQSCRSRSLMPCNVKFSLETEEKLKISTSGTSTAISFETDTEVEEETTEASTEEEEEGVVVGEDDVVECNSDYDIEFSVESGGGQTEESTDDNLEHVGSK